MTSRIDEFIKYLQTYAESVISLFDLWVMRGGDKGKVLEYLDIVAGKFEKLHECVESAMRELREYREKLLGGDENGLRGGSKEARREIQEGGDIGGGVHKRSGEADDKIQRETPCGATVLRRRGGEGE